MTIHRFSYLNNTIIINILIHYLFVCKFIWSYLDLLPQQFGLALMKPNHSFSTSFVLSLKRDFQKRKEREGMTCSKGTQAAAVRTQS